MHKIQYGIDVLLAQQPLWKSKRIALVVTIGWLLIRIIKELHPRYFQWATYPTHVNPTGKKHLDLLSGISNTESLFEAALYDFIDVVKTHIVRRDWILQMQPHLMYT